MIIGIDPGVNNGIAVFEGGKLIELITLTSIDMLKCLSKIDVSTVIIEDSRLQSHLFTGQQKNRATALKIARNVGMVDMVCNIIESYCEQNNVDLIGISPKQKGKKLTYNEFFSHTGWLKKSNQHERDAAIVAWPYRNKRI